MFYREIKDPVSDCVCLWGWRREADLLTMYNIHKQYNIILKEWVQVIKHKNVVI